MSCGEGIAMLAAMTAVAAVIFLTGCFYGERRKDRSV